jgi:hypothetical protein
MRRRSPQEKKSLQYQKERRTGSMHGYVKSYPKTKARLNKAYRHEANVVLKGAGLETLRTAVEVTDELAITRERLRHSVGRANGSDFKPRPDTLREWVDSRLDGRVRLAGKKHFREPYNSERHRKSFGRYLETIMSGRSSRSAEVARFYGLVLSPPDPEVERLHASWSNWLKAFFRDEPEYEGKLRVWIKEMGDLHPS